MGRGKLICASCGTVLNPADAVGQWIECSRCHARFLIDADILVCDEEDAENKESKIFFFPSQCSYQSFRNQCFDMMMRQSPADIFSEMKIVEEKQCYVPYVGSIGGDSESFYKVVYVGTDKHDVIMKRYAELTFKNSDARFGVFQRSHTKSNDQLEQIDVDPTSMSSLPGWASQADEVHYYPFYCMACSYKGSTFIFSSLGDSNIKIFFLPTDETLHRKPTLIDADKEDQKSYSTIVGAVATVIFAVCMVLIFWKDISTWWSHTSDYISYNWSRAKAHDDLFRYILFYGCIVISASWRLLALGIICSIAFVVISLVMRPFVLLVVYLLNRYTMHRCLKRLKYIQTGKQQAAYSRFSVTLDELYDKESNLRQSSTK